jgi:DNA-binding transcriptional LysR family regulator
MPLDLQDLVVFLAVHRHGSFGRAAAELLVTQPAVSERVRHLERVLARPVFERTARGALLTPTGEALVPYARRCVALAAETLEAAREAEGTPRFVVAVHSTFAQRLIPFVLGALGSLPRRVAVRDVHSEAVPALVLDGVAHVGFALTGSARRGLSRVSLPADRVVCVVAPDHPIAQRRQPSIAQLKNGLIAVNAWGDGATGFLDRLRQGGIDEWRVRECADTATAVTLARDHGHVAFVGRSAMRTLSRDGLQEIAMPGLSNWTIRLDLLHRPRDRDDITIRALVGAINEA